MTEWGDGIDLPRPEARALDVLVHRFGGRMVIPDFFVSSTSPVAFRNLHDLGLVRRRLLGYEVTLQGRSLAMQRNEQT